MTQKTLALGIYPEFGHKDAREARDAARKVLARGDDPLTVRKAEKAACRFPPKFSVEKPPAPASELRGNQHIGLPHCQSARNIDPGSASKTDPSFALPGG